MTGPMSLLVIYATDLDESLRFYTACGLEFEPERHGSGPLHYSTSLSSNMVLELYPCGNKPATRTRLGFAVDDGERTLRNLANAGWADSSAPRDLDYGRVRVVRDPDGNAVELVEPLVRADS